ncbi:MAG TPA: nickel-dependent hydrogenase large subunit [Thermoanaerobaculia bacterium]|nr:nickel-dependent hydrogenase large subunit [Thermoanaerobaculia bacterium]
MAQRLTIDPITRIEGHLRIDVEIDNGAVQKAWASSTMWRGIEKILLGRDPREAWLFTQRFCGVCTTVHALASVRAVENALQLDIPLNAQYIRNLILISHALHDHIVHFYQLSALDWVDVTQVLNADPAKASSLGESLSNWTRNSKNEMKAVQDRIKGLVGSGQLGPFAHGYWGHPAMKLPPDVNLLATSHYLQALEYQRYALQATAILGGKTPHIQNLAVGGVSNAVNLNSEATLNLDRLYQFKALMDKVIPFVREVYFNDVCAVAAFYPEWFGYGAGVTNYLSAPDLFLDEKSTQADIPGGVIFNGDLSTYKPITGMNDEYFRKGVTENHTHAYYKGGEGEGLHPWKGETEPDFTDWQADGKYSWVKAPRFEGKPMQVGPLANVLCALAAGNPLATKYATKALETVGAIAKIKAGPEVLHSTLGRHAARAIRAMMLADLFEKHWQLLVDNVLKGDVKTYNPPSFPKGEVEGVGVHEAPRGLLSHWVVVDGGTIKNYQAVVPTTWNASPRDDKGTVGPYEASLLRNPVAQADHPLEVVRTIHSFDPCMACAVHTFDPDGSEVAAVKVL